MVLQPCKADFATYVMIITFPSCRCLLRRFDEEGMLIRKELGKYTRGLVAGLSEKQCQCRKFLNDGNVV